MKSAAPSRMASTAVSTEPWAVMRITVVSGCRALTRRSSSMPSRRGITRSVSTTSWIVLLEQRHGLDAVGRRRRRSSPPCAGRRPCSPGAAARPRRSAAGGRRRLIYLLLRRASCRGGSRPGRPTPRLRRASTSMPPPCAATMLSLTARPRPVPSPTSRVVKNGSKIRSRIAWGMPSPGVAHLDHHPVRLPRRPCAASASRRSASPGPR